MNRSRTHRTSRVVSAVLPRVAALLLLGAAQLGCSAGRDRVRAVPLPDPAVGEVEAVTEAPDPVPDRVERGTERPAAPPEPLPPTEVHVVAPGETLWRIARLHAVELQDLARANGIANPARIAVGQRLLVPARAPAPAAEIQPPVAMPITRARDGLHWPVDGRLSSRFGAPRGRRVHQGIDILVPPGTPVVAANEGTVRFAGRRGAYGRLVILDHANGLTSYYAHNSRLLVGPGERVGRGQKIATSGRSGNATAPHVHFEVRVGGAPVDPLDHLAQ